jgi:hypothetical protein
LGLAGGEAIEFEGQLRVNLGELRQAWEHGFVSSPPDGEMAARSVDGGA